jgi:hypothetical protein
MPAAWRLRTRQGFGAFVEAGGGGYAGLVRWCGKLVLHGGIRDSGGCVPNLLCRGEVGNGRVGMALSNGDAVGARGCPLVGAGASIRGVSDFWKMAVAR